MALSDPIKVQQRDGETIEIGPIPKTKRGAEVANPPYYDAGTVLHTCRLLIKATRHDADASGTTIIGSLAGDTTSGYYATFDVPTALTATAGVKWAHAWIAPTGGNPQTIRYCPLHVEAT